MIEDNSEYNGINAEDLLHDRLPAVLSTLFWPHNTHVYASSAANQLSFWSLIHGSYEQSMRGALNKEMSIPEAHDAAKEHFAAIDIPYGHLVWGANLVKSGLTEGKWSDAVPIGYKSQVPQPGPNRAPHIERISHALVVYGDNRPSELFDWFKGNAEKWQLLMGEKGARVLTVRPGSYEELRKAVNEITPAAGEIESRLLLVVMGHGSAVTLFDERFGVDDLSSGQRHGGEIALGEGYCLDEQTLKSLVRQNLSDKFKEIDIVFGSCHSGAWVE